MLLFARRALKIICKRLTTCTGPADLSGRVTGHKRVIGHIFCHDCSCADKSIAADSMAADDGAVGPQGSTFPDKGWANLIHLADFRPGIVDVCENHGRPAENAVFQCNTFIDTDVVLYLALVADYGIGTNNNVLADITFFADFRSGQNMREVPDFCVLADFHIVINDGSRMDKGILGEG